MRNVKLDVSIMVHVGCKIALRREYPCTSLARVLRLHRVKFLEFDFTSLLFIGVYNRDIVRRLWNLEFDIIAKWVGLIALHLCLLLLRIF